jgi:hypothetical protein
MRENEDLNVFAEALRSLRPRTGLLDGAWRSMLAKGAAATPCREHLFLCVRCGEIGSPDRIARTTGPAAGECGKRRWLWPAACAAMTTTAAVLLAAILIRPESRPQSDERTEPPTTTADATAVSPIGPADEAAAPMPRDISRWEATRARGNGEPILTAGDANLPGDLLERYLSAENAVAAGRKPASLNHLETADASLTNYELLQRLLKSTEANGGASRAAAPKPFPATEQPL